MSVTCCRACGLPELALILDLGCTPLANCFVHPDQAGVAEPTYPLRLVRCDACGLVQIDQDVPPEILFKDYLYVSGTSDLIHAHAAQLAGRYQRQLALGRDDLVVEIGSNDGTLLEAFGQLGVQTLGIEPAENLADLANQRGLETWCAYFDEETAERIRAARGPARLILARHVLAHAADLAGFLRGLAALLRPDGLIAVEVPHLLPFFENLEYDTIYHEHRCYFSVGVLDRLFARFGLEVVDVTELAIHGGSVLLTAQPAGGPHRRERSVGQVVRREEQAGLHQAAPWRRFADGVQRARALLRQEIDRLLAAGRKLAGYGAPAKGMTLLAYCGIGPERLPYLIDRSPCKQGLLTPGQRIPIAAPAQLRDDPPDVLLVLAWNFAAEIVRQQDEFRRRGGRFLLPVPQPHYWN